MGNVVKQGLPWNPETLSWSTPAFSPGLEPFQSTRPIKILDHESCVAIGKGINLKKMASINFMGWRTP
jgi:hypothetical protein